MKKQIVKVLLSTMLCVTLAGTTCFAGELSTTGDQEITGDNTVENPIYRLVIPTDLVYAVDAFEQKGQSQIYSEDYGIINKSNVAVKVNVKVKVEPAANVTLMNSASEVSEADESKNLFFAAEVPSAVAETAVAGAAYKDTAGAAVVGMTTDADGNYYMDDDTYKAVTGAVDATGATAKNDEMVDTTAVAGTYAKSAVVGLGSDAASMTFALKGADYITYYDNKADVTSTAKAFKSVAGTEAGTATFRFTGTVNTKAAWAASDLTAKAVYSMIGLSPTNYDALIAKEVAIDDTTTAHGYVQEAPAEAAPSIANTASSTALGVDATWTVNLGGGTLAATNISKIQFSKNGVMTNLDSQYFELSGSTLTIKKAVSDVHTSYAVTFNDTAATKVNVTITRP